MSKNINNNLLINPFLILIDFINIKNCKLNLEVSVTDAEDIVSKFDSDMFFKAGQLLMFFYIMNINNMCKTNIKYKNNKFYIYMPINSFNENCIKTITSENIIINLIQKSTYNKEYLPVELDSINEENLLEIENGFELTYKTFIEEKISIITFLGEYGFENIYLNLIKDIKLLNPHDLKMQLQFIRLKFEKKLKKNKLVEELICTKYDYDDFIESSNNLLDLLIENAIISLDKNGMELMWIGYINETLMPIKYRNIYIAILFSYIGNKTSKKYYLQAAKHSINPLLMDIKNLNSNYKDILDDKYYEVLKLLYLLNNYIEFRELDEFIEENIDLFDLITLGDKLKCNSEIENLILKYISNKSLDLLKLLVIN